MKTLLTIIVVLLSSIGGYSQGTIEFSVNLRGTNVVPPNTSSGTAFTSVTLTGASLSYWIVLYDLASFYPTSAEIRGPALPEANGNIIFDLGDYYLSIRPQGGADPAYLGGFTLSNNQISELLSGQWYFNINTAAYPNGELRGQIVVVPEPSAIVLLVIGGILPFVKMLRRAQRFSAQSP